MKKLIEDIAFQNKLTELAQETGLSVEEVREESIKYIKELYTEHKPITEILASQVIQYLLSRGYDKTIDVDAFQIKQLTKLAQRYSIAYVMTHKTYIDMMVLAIVLIRYGLPIPFTFAGINMSFLGLSQFGKNAGVIFIRRSFKENVIYKVTLRYFIAHLLKLQGSFMWAIEGTRSRTGKIFWPKMGILKYIREAEQESKKEVKYVPISIVYDLIPDVKDMTEEGRGRKKRPESLSWFINYFRKMGDHMGRISLRIGDPVNLEHIPYEKVDLSLISGSEDSSISRFAIELVHRINKITPVTTSALVCISLLSKYALTKRAIESDIAALMQLIESHRSDALVDRGKIIGESVQIGLNLLERAEIVHKHGEGLYAKYAIKSENFLQATYYANMAVHHFYPRAFIELALLRICELPVQEREVAFWTDIMEIRDLFKFEFFYSSKPVFTEKIEADIQQLADLDELFYSKKCKVSQVLENQKLFVAPVVLHTYIDAYQVVAHGLKSWDVLKTFDEDEFIKFCLFHGGEMQWQGKIHRIESVSKPFLINGIRLVKNLDLIPTPTDSKKEKIEEFLVKLEDVGRRTLNLQAITLSKYEETLPEVPVERNLVPGSVTEDITNEILAGESGPHIGAFFDLDRTLINGFSAKNFLQARILSGKMTTKEVIAQFAGVLVYAMGNRNFASLASLGAKGVKGIREDVFIKVGEEVYLDHLADAIYPESRALVSAHLSKGHSVAIVSAATPYQVDPVARDLGIRDVMCTRMEIQSGKFTGKIVEPTCWGKGKAIAATSFSEERAIKLDKSYFYTDSISDLPLLEIVGHPRPINPDARLSSVSFENDWPIYRFKENPPSTISSLIRTGLVAGSLFPAAFSGIFMGLVNLSWRDGVNSMMANFGDIGTAMAGIKLIVKGRRNLEAHRPAIFIFNHQSGADIFIVAKLLRKDARAIAKQELKHAPILGQLMVAAGVIFIDRKDREKAIEALKPAVDALKAGTSIAIAPEGTRSADYTLGKFKKGAFHMAMQAQVPLVPIIIKNAHDAMPKGTNVFKPAYVEVIVGDPISTDHWTVEGLDGHIEAVRYKFLKELGQIPVLEN